MRVGMKAACVAVLALAGCDAEPDASPTTAGPAHPATRLGDVAVAIGLVEQPGGQVAVTYTLTNLGSQPIATLKQPALELIDPAGTALQPTATAAIATGQDFFGTLDPDLAPGKATTLRSLWPLPAGFDRATWHAALSGHENTPLAL